MTFWFKKNYVLLQKAGSKFFKTALKCRSASPEL